MLCQRCIMFQDDIGSMISLDAKGSSRVSTSPTALAPNLNHEASLFSSIQELREAIESRCPVCRCVSKCVDSQEIEDLSAAKAVTTILLLSLKNGRGSLRARFEDATTAGSPVIKLIRTVAIYASHDSDVGSSEALDATLSRCAELDNDSTGSSASFELAAHWLRECQTNHGNCSRPDSDSGWLPDRVIDVGPCDASHLPRLIDTAELPSRLPASERAYVALSHCWGPKQIITTTRATYGRHTVGISTSELSQTFRDAVEATRRLGQRFLWIDSLCIIQDSKDDWEAQSVQMCTIYQRALFTIMAAHAHGGDEGCFVERDGLAQMPFRLIFKAPDEERRAVGTATFLPLSRMSSELSFELPLFTRAWVLQEQAISRARLIYFGEQVLWECQSARGSERCPNGGTMVSGLTDFTRAITAPGDLFAAAQRDDVNGYMADVHVQWCALVENYMQRGITHSSDRLIALDGLAQVARERTSNQYLAGLWRDQLVIGLMWYIPWDAGSTERWTEHARTAETYMSSRHATPLAPSWSWASVTYPVEWPFSRAIKADFMNMKVLCKIVDAAVEGTPFAQTGSVTIRGLTRRMYVDAYYQSLHFLGKTKNPKLKELGVLNRDYRPHAAWALCNASNTKPASRKSFASYPIAFLPDELLDWAQELTFIALAEVPAQRKADRASFYFTRPTLLTLVLQPTDRPNTYRRVGLAQWHNCSWYGYFCLGDNHHAEHRAELKTGKLVGGWRRFWRELLEVLLVLVWGGLLRQPILKRQRDGVVWFRQLVRGAWGRHSHGVDVAESRAYRKGWEPKKETVIVP